MANFNFNKVILGGRLTADPELRQTPNGIQVTSFSIAVNRKSSGEQSTADFINCVAWRSTAEFISRYFKKGSSLCITGSIQTRTWNDNTGAKRYATEVVVDEAMFVDSRSDSAAQSNYVPDAYGSPSFSSGAEAPNFEEIKTDDDLPF